MGLLKIEQPIKKKKKNLISYYLPLSPSSSNTLEQGLQIPHSPCIPPHSGPYTTLMKTKGFGVQGCLSKWGSVSGI